METLFETDVFNIVLIHVARTWERIRINQPYEEMPLDNIESTDALVEIADSIMMDDIIQEFLHTRDGNVWLKTEEGISDSYIERLAEEMINSEYF